MSRQIYDDVELSLDEINSIDCCDEEYDRTADLSKRISIVADMKNVLKLVDDDDDDDADDENQQSWRQSIEKEIGKQHHTDQQSRPFLPPQSHEYPCKDTCKKLPQPPEHWPQRPLMIRPTPLSSMTVIGIRRATGDDYEDFRGFCAGCILPINNGKEAKGESLVVDFESKHFIGTLFLRIKQVPSHRRKERINQDDDINNTVEDGQNNQGDYFADKKRKFQAIVKGSFKTPLSLSRCMTGQLFERPAGPLPARWIVKSFIKFISILAPQLDASLDGNKPRFLTPLVATAQTVIVEDDDVTENVDCCLPPSGNGGRRLKINTEVALQEPSTIEPSSILSDLPTNSSLGINIPNTTTSSVASRMSVRKNVFNKIAVKENSEPRFETNKIYTFEFFQHLLDFSGDELALDMGRIGGMVPLAQAMDGQPLKILAAYRHNEGNHEELDTLWSFDIFHESLYPYALEQNANDTQEIQSR